MKLKFLFRSSLYLFLSFMVSCTSHNPHKVDLKGHEATIKIQRYEDAIFKINNEKDFKSVMGMDSTFFQYYFYDYRLIGGITGGNNVDSIQFMQNLLKYTHHENSIDLLNEVKKAYPSTEKLEAEFSKAFSYYHYHFPDKVVPKIFTFISPFFTANVPMDSALGIGLDMFLGADFEPYRGLGTNFPNYKIKKMRETYILPISMTSWLKSEFVLHSKASKLIDEMVYEGKILYALDAILPDTEDSLKIGYFQGQLEWCKQNEVNIWTNFVKEDLLYSTQRKYWDGTLYDGPFSKGTNVPQESSPKIAAFAGWQMVRKYMKKFPETTLEQLFNKVDAETILVKSKYKP